MHIHTYTYAYRHTYTKYTDMQPRLADTRTPGGVEDTKFSTNKQHTLSQAHMPSAAALDLTT